MQLPEKLQKKLQDREKNNALRRLPERQNLIDFSSNDYLGLAQEKGIFNEVHRFLEEQNICENGATGSRLLSGNHKLYEKTETLLAKIHNTEAALLFNSGYDANVGFLSAVLQRGDIIFYDELVHASIRDGIKMSNAKSYRFVHNDLNDLQKKLHKTRLDVKNHTGIEIYVITESVFSMDGDTPDLRGFGSLCQQYNCRFVVDEAHAVGVYGECGVGLIQQLGLENQVFARINTFGKAMGCHGAVILGSESLKKYLINFARSFIYTTGLPPHSLATIHVVYQHLLQTNAIKKLIGNITFFNQKAINLDVDSKFIKSNSTIHCCLISGNENVKKVASQLQKSGFDVKPILSPTVPQGQERLRFCIHSYNSTEEISKILELLATFV
ncbi:aminotransferase class I/II-fold pyridoxal phosphate-dependent enzyme [Aquimarina aquimarini]|uniref:aminotransferase class I/II-fold pyridoxal phosphate-dependent enzyme n=1 Tax=Aquimarina aquimarini TaxID=1191734 RepID=UPI000D55584B|nr:pyridoxal phosphate-dependent aminotransferase family protein [Aquimarina aquimarini]